jgi:hypothetical protein
MFAFATYLRIDVRSIIVLGNCQQEWAEDILRLGAVNRMRLGAVSRFTLLSDVYLPGQAEICATVWVRCEIHGITN